ncbi:hypothetical protein NQ317_017479 [Molorchus minor]|uniref:Creatinase N-terminal domain-containing protein n=1 Tax=Molorchus minor TaxID=1323400 RepID=A0ABQ9JKN5_9CUCU|nr:hypothetical protein NQ317_017479 [Molorchus minor]
MPPKSTTNLLKQLRGLMQNSKYVVEPVHAYIIPSDDAHTSEYTAKCDQFREYISGFNGSAGTAVITYNEACLWTDGRYFLQASQQLDSNWTLMKEGIPTTPNEGTWLSKNLPSGSRIGIDPSHFPCKSHKLVPISTNLIELIWTDRPERPANPKKLEALNAQMSDKNAKHLILTALDEIAWFLNLRGSDIDYNPVFFSYVVVSVNSFTLFLNPIQATTDVKRHLTSEAGDIYNLEPYSVIEEKLKELVKKS